MPYHSTKNIHRADHEIRQEQLDWEMNDQDYASEIFTWIQIPYYTKGSGFTDTIYYNIKHRVDPFNHYWSIEKQRQEEDKKNNKYSCPKCRYKECLCSFGGCTCYLCYEISRANRCYTHESLVQKYFSAQEINDANNQIITEHTKKKRSFCACISKKGTTSVFLKQERVKHLLSEKEGIQTYEPLEVNMKLVSDCTIKHLFNILKEEAKKEHDQNELNEKVAILAKYGMTLEDHEEAKRKRREEALNMNA